MGKVKISSLQKDEFVYIEGFNTMTVSEILEDIETYRDKELYTTIPHSASFDAGSIVANAIENEQENGMYEDWDESIEEDITEEDIADLQKVFDRILARNPSQNIAYESNKLIEIDV
jgi:hypothetical protein